MHRNLKRLIVDTGAFRHSPDEPFVLASGQTSPYYFDMRLLNAHPEGLHLAAVAVLESMPDRARSVGGLEAGAIPLATAVSLESRGTDNPLKSFYVRKRPKAHGTGRLVEGVSEPPYVLVDDVITTGSSVLRAAAAAGDGCVGIRAILFRGTEKDRERLEGTAPLSYIFTQDDFASIK